MTYRETELVETVVSDEDGEQRVGEDPGRHQSGPEALVGILQILAPFLLGRMIRRQCPLDRLFELTVDVGLGFVRFLDDGGLTFFGGGGRREGVGLVSTLRSPRHIVPIAKSVDVQDVDVG